MGGGIGLTLGARRGLKVSPEEITIASSIAIVAFSSLFFILGLSWFFFQNEKPEPGLMMYFWSFIVFAPITGFCALLILANVIAAMLRKQLIPWNYLLRLSRIATIAAGLLTAIMMAANPQRLFPIALILLPPIALQYWVLVCWIRIETETEKLSDSITIEARRLPETYDTA